MASHSVTFMQGLTRMLPSGVVAIDPAGVLSAESEMELPVGVVKLQDGAA